MVGLAELILLGVKLGLPGIAFAAIGVGLLVEVYLPRLLAIAIRLERGVGILAAMEQLALAGVILADDDVYLDGHYTVVMRTP
jgi:hypothetical protein